MMIDTRKQGYFDSKHKSLATTKATFNMHQKLFVDEEAKSNNTHNWLDKNVINQMITNFNSREGNRNLVKTAQPMKLRESKT